VLARDALREPEQIAGGDVAQLTAVGAQQVVVLLERRFVFGGAARVREELDEADPAQDVEGTVNRPEAHAR